MMNRTWEKISRGPGRKCHIRTVMNRKVSEDKNIKDEHVKIQPTDSTQETKLIRLRDFSDEGNSLTMGRNFIGVRVFDHTTLLVYAYFDHLRPSTARFRIKHSRSYEVYYVYIKNTSSGGERLLFGSKTLRPHPI